jgi:hypothetical protein
VLPGATTTPCTCDGYVEEITVRKKARKKERRKERKQERNNHERKKDRRKERKKERKGLGWQKASLRSGVVAKDTSQCIRGTPPLLHDNILIPSVVHTYFQFSSSPQSVLPSRTFSPRAIHSLFSIR